jgi:hypothetical protein
MMPYEELAVILACLVSTDHIEVEPDPVRSGQLTVSY